MKEAIDFEHHQLQQRVLAALSQCGALAQRVDRLEAAPVPQAQPLLIITEAGNVLPWTEQPLVAMLSDPENGIFRVLLGDEWVSGKLSPDTAKLLIKACLDSRLAHSLVFDVGAFLNG